MTGTASQDGFRVRFGWGPDDLAALGPGSHAVVVVDVLRFTTAVSVAVARGATVVAHRWNDATAAAAAADRGAEVAGRRREAGRWSLSPTDLQAIPAGTRLVLPSPNGATLALAAAATTGCVVAGSLRNASAVGHRLRAGEHEVVTVIAAGERWPGAGDNHDGPLRPAVEDLLGAGAVIDALLGDGRAGASPEARAARAAFTAVADLRAELLDCVSGRELAGRGWADDVETAARLDADDVVPVLVAGAFTAAREVAG